MVASKASGLMSLNNAGMEEAAAVKSKRKWRLRLVQFVVVFSAVILCLLLYTSRFSAPTPYGGATDFVGPRVDGNDAEEDEDGGAPVLDNQVHSPCSSLPSHSICCDRSDPNADVCFMSGDVRTDAASLSLLLFPPPPARAAATVEEERIQPYTRKWDGKIMGDIHEVRLRVARPEEEAAAGAAHRCDVRHDAPVHVVTAGGYNGNYFHAFNDGFLPSWITVQHLRRRVVLAVLAYNPTWARKYAEVISGLSDYRVVDLLNDNRTHCFPGAIVGTRFHDYLTVDPTRLRDNKTIVDFHQFLAGLYEPELEPEQPPPPARRRRRPRLGIVSRRGTRVIENQAAVAELAASVGFDVDVLQTDKETPVSAVYASVRALDALVGAHGSDLTSFLFLRPGGAALAQVAPLGVTEPSRGLFGAPAVMMGLHYEQYDVLGHESSLSRKYSPDDVVVADPGKARLKPGSGGTEWDWDFIGRVYLGGQNVSLDLDRFRETLERMHAVLLQEQESQVAAADAST